MPLKMIPLIECEDRTVYILHSRNLTVGAFSKKEAGFVGIRKKFGERFLFMEFHYDTGAPYGTVRPLKKLSVLPEEILPSEYSKITDRATKRPVACDHPVGYGGKGWYFADTGEFSRDIWPEYAPNDKLFELLEKLESSLPAKCNFCKRQMTADLISQNGRCIVCEAGIY
ncbi:hypothetical protein ACFL6Y_05775 [Elusimicrobiota bacterium]